MVFLFIAFVPYFGVVLESFFSWVALPLFIFFARVADVSLGTIRLIFISKGFRNIAPFIGFFEILIWLFAISQIVQNLSEPLLMVAYAGGFATGTYVGILIEEKLSIGKVRLRIVAKKSSLEIMAALNTNNFPFTATRVDDPEPEARSISLLLDRKKISKVLAIIRGVSPNVFYSIEDVRSVSEEPPHTHTFTFWEFAKNRLQFKKGK
ncbi:MAG: DUF5698 domain-containing protein [archaeon]|nr:DUF5698 domain-containing protein [archaeon]